MEQVKFTQLKDGDEEDFRFMLQHDTDYAGRVGERLLQSLGFLKNSFSAFQITRLEHSLQSATRAWLDGADNDWVVTALLHDIGDVHAPYNHCDYAATVLAPFVREQCTWSTRFHGDFQTYYFPEGLGVNTNARDKHSKHIYFNDCAEFCERWDGPSFDPAFKSLQLEKFRPLVLEVFSRKPFDPEVIRQNAREPLIRANVAEQRKAETL